MIKKKFRTTVFSFLFTGLIGLGAFSPIYAVTYTRTKTASLSTAVGSGVIHAYAAYTTTGNTRWNYSSYATTNVSPLKSISTSNSSVKMSEKALSYNVNMAISTTDYRTGYASKDFKFSYNGSSVN